jgi:acyl carrier protein
MADHLLEDLVLGAVLARSGRQTHISLKTDLVDLDVDQLTMTYIVLELEEKLGIELPCELEDARTVAELVASTEKAMLAQKAPTRFVY